MFKYITLPLFFACVSAGYLGAPAYPAQFAYSAPVVAAPALVKAHVPVATSYQNTYKISSGAVAYAAPVVKAAPVVHAAPVAYAAAAPVAYAAHAAPVAYAAHAAPLAYAAHAAPYAYHGYAAPTVVKSAYPW